VGEKLGKAEVEKRRAVESEDYDRAKVKKQQMDEYRRLAYENLRIAQLLDSSMVQHVFLVISTCNTYLGVVSYQIMKRS